MASSSNETVNFWNMIPPGFRFEPKDEELITHYLVPKINGEALPPNKMHETVLYGVLAPQDLTLYYEPESENTWYFFTRLERLYENGSRPRRSAGNGYWKATGVDATIRNKQGVIIGHKKALAFFIKIEPPPINKNEPKGIKTPWLMHEFRLANTSEPKPKRRKTNDHNAAHSNTTSHSEGSKPKNMLDGWVLCKVYKLGRDVAVDEAPIIPVAQEEHDQVVVHSQEEHNQVVHVQEVHNHQVVHAQEEDNQVVHVPVSPNKLNYTKEDILRHLELDEDVLHHPQPTDDPLLNSFNMDMSFQPELLHVEEHDMSFQPENPIQMPLPHYSENFEFILNNISFDS
ncbi:protein ATAF2-like [Chenopodium quinoa]|uniref:NAC domain-containing protein n=1 Tax=Chenopodium quinoa TaxID=63459 RepID=A0A803M9K4_CHEQI|nr:protein ATAF2-like [Chenopodium quinoa]